MNEIGYHFMKVGINLHMNLMKNMTNIQGIGKANPIEDEAPLEGPIYVRKLVWSHVFISPHMMFSSSICG